MHLEDTYLYINILYPPIAGEKKKKRKEEKETDLHALN